MYVYMAAHRIPFHIEAEPDSILTIFFEIVFLVDICVNFILSYEHETAAGRTIETRVDKISTNYLKTEFLYDLIPSIPLQFFKFYNNRECLFYLIKLMRLFKGFDILDVFEMMKKIKAVYKAKSIEKIRNDSFFANDINEDHNNVGQQLNIFYGLKIFKIVIIIMNFAYMLGMFWYILMKAVEDFGGYDYKTVTESGVAGQPFILFYGLQNRSESFITITMTYYAFTSLSTVGFGDYAPRSDLERAIGSMILLIGVALFSYIMGNFIEILNSYLKFNADVEDGENLSRFFGIVKEFNGKQNIPDEL